VPYSKGSVQNVRSVERIPARRLTPATPQVWGVVSILKQRPSRKHVRITKVTYLYAWSMEDRPQVNYRPKSKREMKGETGTWGRLENGTTSIQRLLLLKKGSVEEGRGDSKLRTHIEAEQSIRGEIKQRQKDDGEKDRLSTINGKTTHQ